MLPTITSFTTPSTCQDTINENIDRRDHRKTSSSKNTITTGKPRKTENGNSDHAHGESNGMLIKSREGAVAGCAFEIFTRQYPSIPHRKRREQKRMGGEAYHSKEYTAAEHTSQK